MLDGQHVVIFGGSSGIGLATARRAVQLRAEVTIVGRDPAKLAAAQEALPELKTADGDATSGLDLERILHGMTRIDHLVMSTATGGGAGAFATLDLEMLRRAIDGKLMAYLLTLQMSLKLIPPTGSVCFVSAASARMAAPGTAGLAANDGAVNAAVAPLAAELAPRRVNAVCPGVVDTPIFDRWPAELRERVAERAARTPAGRLGQPEEIAEAILFCLANRFVTGALLDCDGGARLVH